MAAHEQVQDFLKFFASKRDITVAEVGSLFEETRDTRVLEDMYSRDEVEELLDSLLGAVQDTARRDLEKASQMAALVLEQVIAQAKRAGVDVDVDMSKTEDESLLADVGKARDDSFGKEAEEERRATTTKLESLKDEHTRLASESEKMSEQVAQLQERNKTVMAQCTKALREKSEATERVRELEEELASLRSRAVGAESKAAESVAASTATAGEVEGLRNTVAALRDELTEARALAAAAMEEAAGANARVSETKQFQQLRSMLTKKNTQLTDLRKRLAVYEPDTTPLVEEGAGGGAGRK
uniref:Leucine zipper transcription factor-like protein 1 n=1 Tax=Bicosoecida sp. CB-2014 TaxID=1486930 RepID=A0A7S1G303_9STRA